MPKKSPNNPTNLKDVKAARKAAALSPNMTAGAFAAHYLKTYARKDLAPETRDDYELYAAQLAYYFDDLAIRELEPWHVDWLKQEVGEREGYKTKFNHLKGFLQMICDQAAICGLRSAQTNPCRFVRKYIGAEKTHHLTLEQREKFPGMVTQLVLAGLMTVQAGGLALAMFLIGLRWSDARFLMWSECELDAEPPYLRIKERGLMREQSKNNDGKRRIKLSPEATALLRSMPRISDYVFPNPKPRRNGAFRPYTSIRKQLKRLYEMLGVTWRGYHGLRHTVGTCAANRRASAKQVAELLGQANEASAKRYMHLDDHAIVDAVELMTDELLGKARADMPRLRNEDDGSHRQKEGAPLRRTADLQPGRASAGRSTSTPAKAPAAGGPHPRRTAHASA